MQFTRERIRLKLDVESLDAQIDQVTSQSPEMWRNNDCQFEIGCFYNGEPIDASPYATITLLVKEKDHRRTSLPLMKKAVNIESPVFTTEEWNTGAKQHAVIPFDYLETRLDLLGNDSRDFFVSVFVAKIAGGRLTMGQTVLRMWDDGDNETSLSPPIGSTIIPQGAVYNGVGQYVLAVTPNRYYAYAKNANDTKIINGTEEVLASGNFITQGNSITFVGSANGLITATLRYPVWATLDELDTRFQKKDTPFRKSPNGRWMLEWGIDDNGNEWKLPTDLQSLP